MYHQYYTNILVCLVGTDYELPEDDTIVSKHAKQSRNRHGVAQRFPGGLGSQIFNTLGTLIW